ncbi:phosphate acyltransferase [Campylobacterota bacterium]|nr:phosphate acyltransferase [Campylobacterota bacterium]
MVRIAIDAMGGDFGCKPIVEGCSLAIDLAKSGGFEFEPILVGESTQILTHLRSDLHKKVKIIEAADTIAMSDHATDALKRRESSIYKAVELVAKKEADAVVSAGHSGATMSLATLKIGRLKGISRPALATLMPTAIEGKKSLVLDVGANVDSEPKHLFQSAIMGKAYASQLLKLENPRVGLLANGEEEGKGDKLVKESFLMIKELREEGFNFVGNVEGCDVFKGEVDVIVCDGFVGNVLLKTSEGISEAIVKVLKRAAKQSFLTTVGALLFRPAFKTLKQMMDYDEYGGAPLLGINGTAIISHGKSTPKAVLNAILQAVRFAESNVNSEIVRYLDRYALKGEN